jgi:MFS family permease
MCTGSVKNMAGLVVCRCFLGIFEAGFGAGAPYFLSMFYQRRELALRVSLLLGMSPLANCFASALAYGITHITGSIESWRLLFIIEGAPTVLFAPIVFFFLPDSPSQAQFLNESQQTTAVERLQTRDTTAKGAINWTHFLSGVLDYRNIIHTLIHFACNYSFAGLSNFLPTIIKAMGYSSINAQGLSAPVYFASFLLCVVAAFVSDRYGRRGFIISGFATMGCIGYALLAGIKDMEKTGVRYLGVWLAVCGIFPALCINITWLLNNNSSDSKRGAGLAVLAIFGQCSSFLSSAVFPKADAPFFVKGCAIGCGFTGAIVILSLGLYLRLAAINREKDRVFGIVENENEQFDVTTLGDKHPQFRYLL